MEAIIFSIGFCIAGVLIGWELKNVIQKFKEDRKGMRLSILRDQVKEKAREDAMKGLQAREIIDRAEKIINDHLRRKQVQEALRKQQQQKEDE